MLNQILRRFVHNLNRSNRHQTRNIISSPLNQASGANGSAEKLSRIDPVHVPIRTSEIADLFVRNSSQFKPSRIEIDFTDLSKKYYFFTSDYWFIQTRTDCPTDIWG